jgi:hypothetical protein
VSKTNKYYWFQRNHFIVAVDAVSRQDAYDYAKIYIPGAVYHGLFDPGTFPKTACGAITSKRQNEIISNNEKEFKP